MNKKGMMMESANEEMNRRAYRVEEMAKLFGISRSAAYKLVSNGHIHCVRAGKLILIPADALDTFLTCRQ